LGVLKKNDIRLLLPEAPEGLFQSVFEIGRCDAEHLTEVSREVWLISVSAFVSKLQKIDIGVPFDHLRCVVEADVEQMD
jgi:hypothetical protein